MKQNSQQTDAKPTVIYFSKSPEMADLIKGVLNLKFEVTTTSEALHVDDALEAIRQTRPDYVLVDSRSPHLDHLQLYRHTKADKELVEIRFLIISDDGEVRHYQ